jgi:hypothetical protein
MATIDSINTMASTAGTGVDSAMSAASAAAQDGSPGAMMQAQIKMAQAQFALTATSEIIKSWGEGQKNIAKNMSI